MAATTPAQDHTCAAAQALDLTPGQCLRSLDFWLLWVANGIASGAGLTLLNNLGQQARGRIDLSGTVPTPRQYLSTPMDRLHSR